MEDIGGFISKIQFNDGQVLTIDKNSIVIFVGPNNAGKSQTLKDIYTLSEEKRPSVVVSDIEIIKESGSIQTVLNKIAPRNDMGSCSRYSFLGKDVNYFDFSEQQFREYQCYDNFRDLFVANLDTSARLTICKAPGTSNRNEAKSHPIHYSAFHSDYRKWLSENFQKAFNTELIPNIYHGATIPLCMGENIHLEDIYEDEQSRTEAYAQILESYPRVDEQGDGIKSFTGILLYLMLDYYRTYLIDEPESFLHPPQAKIMGQIIGSTLKKNQQAFISTHSEEILKGLLEVCPERIKIVRITREGNNNHFSILDSEKFNGVWSDPILKYSNIMTSLFHKCVVLCESDSDCKMYSIVESFLKQKKGNYSETLFIQCGGKHRMAKIVQALRSLDVNIKLIPDIDVMNDENVFRNIIESFEIDWDSIKSDYNTIISNLHSEKESINRTQAKNSINAILDGSKADIISNKDLKIIRNILKTSSKWERIKKEGISAIPSGNATVAFKKIDEILKSKGIYMVPVGELEGFVKEIGGHGPDWANNVLEKYTDLDDPVYDSIKQFVESMNL